MSKKPDWEGFARKAMESWPYGGLDGGDLQDLAEQHGLIVAAPGGYDPTKHGPCDCGCEPGDPYYQKRTCVNGIIAISESSIVTDSQWYCGTAIGSFDGVLAVADARGERPQIVLRLTAGASEIECIGRAADLPNIGRFFNRRVRVTGSAFYDGKSGLPSRVEIVEIEPVPEGGDFARWRGAVEAFQESEWIEDTA